MVPNLVDSSMTNPSLQNVNHGGSASFSIFYIFSKPTCQRYGWWCKDAHFDPPVIKHGNGNRPFISDFPKKTFIGTSHCHIWWYRKVHLFTCCSRLDPRALWRSRLWELRQAQLWGRWQFLVLLVFASRSWAARLLRHGEKWAIDS